MTEKTEHRIGVANLVLDTFMPGVNFYHSRELRMCWDVRKQPPKHDFPARLRAQGDWPAYGYNQRCTGGTGYNALGQLIRYVRDLSRFPMMTWEYWAGDAVKLCNARTLDILRSGGYDDPAKTRCVLCGDVTFARGLDWWSLGGVTGPSCWGGRCRPIENTA